MGVPDGADARSGVAGPRVGPEHGPRGAAADKPRPAGRHLFRCRNAECVRQAESEGYFFGVAEDCPDCGQGGTIVRIADGLVHHFVSEAGGPLSFWGDGKLAGTPVRQPPRFRDRSKKPKEIVRGVVSGYVACRPRLRKPVLSLTNRPDRVTCPECRKRGGLCP